MIYHCSKGVFGIFRLGKGGKSHTNLRFYAFKMQGYTIYIYYPKKIYFSPRPFFQIDIFCRSKAKNTPFFVVFFTLSPLICFSILRVIVKLCSFDFQQIPSIILRRRPLSFFFSYFLVVSDRKKKKNPDSHPCRGRGLGLGSCLG